MGDSGKLRTCVLGSGSKGNATFVATDTVRVLFDAGFSCRQIKQRLESIGEDVRALDAVVVSHEHSDHVRGLEVLARQTGVRIFATPLTAARLSWIKSTPELATFEAGRRFVIGDLEIGTFTVSHDAIDPVGFCVRNNGCKISIATDLGYITDSVRYHLAGSELLVIESNHDLEMLKTGPYPWELKQRVMSRDGHLSNTAVAEYLARRLGSPGQDDCAGAPQREQQSSRDCGNGRAQGLGVGRGRRRHDFRRETGAPAARGRTLTRKLAGRPGARQPESSDRSATENVGTSARGRPSTPAAKACKASACRANKGRTR